MLTLSEIEEAVNKLGTKEQVKLLEFIVTKLNGIGEEGEGIRRELLLKWQNKSTDVLEKHRGTLGYLKAIRKGDQDRR